MKRLIIAIIFIALSLSSGVYIMTKTTNECDELINELSEILEYNVAINENSVSHTERIEFYNKTFEVYKLWNEKSSFFHLVFDNSEIKSIEVNMKKLPVHIKNGDLEAGYICASDTLKDLEYLKEASFPTITNIF